MRPDASIRQQTREAKGQIRLAIQRLAGKYPFHAKILERFVVQSSPSVNTIGVTVSDNDVLLLYNASFTLSLPMDELVGVLLHETHHVLLGHLLADANDYPDHWARTVAEEVTVNEFIVEPLPSGAIRLDRFPKLQAMQSTGQRYHQLKNDRQRMALATPADSQESGAAKLSKGAGPSKRQGTAGGIVIDDHTVWAEARNNKERSAEIICTIVHDAAVETSAKHIPDQLLNALGGMGIGNLPGAAEEQLTACNQGRLQWPQLLRRYTGQQLVVRPSFRWPSRRFPKLIGVMPGRRRSGARPRIMVVIDTSGSLTTHLLEQISGELARLSGNFEVTVVECDEKIHNVYKYKPLEALSGRGGTDLRPPFEPGFLRRHRPDLIIYFTDGFGPAPERPPNVPVIWCLTVDSQTPAKWGRVIQMVTV